RRVSAEVAADRPDEASAEGGVIVAAAWNGDARADGREVDVGAGRRSLLRGNRSKQRRSADELPLVRRPRRGAIEEAPDDAVGGIDDEVDHIEVPKVRQRAEGSCVHAPAVTALKVAAALKLVDQQIRPLQGMGIDGGVRADLLRADQRQLELQQ